MSTVKENVARFRAGDWVSFPYGTRHVMARILEDRGPIGVGRRRLYRVCLGGVDEESDTFEMPEDDLKPEMRREDIRRYLQAGGLLQILRANLAGGRDQPRAWLTLDRDGQVGHTFEGGTSRIGGAVVPFFALHDGRIFEPYTQQVVAFLGGFGMDRAAAEGLIESVGTSP